MQPRMMQPRTLMTIFAVALFALAHAAAAHAQSARAYVTELRGSDLNPCTRSEPCRQIQQGLSVVAAGGSVVVLDSGDYEPFTVDKAATVEAAPGVSAAVNATGAGAAVTVAAGAGDAVVLRGLALYAPLPDANGAGAVMNGILFNSAAALHVENCVVQGFATGGIHITGGGKVFIKDTTARNNGTGVRIFAGGAAPAFVAIENSRLEHNATGLLAGGTVKATLSRTLVAGNTARGVFVDGSSNFYTRVEIESCVIAGNNVGIRVKGAPTQPIPSGGVARVANTRITQNTTGLVPENGTLLSYGNNRLAGNNVAGTFTGTIQQQ